MAEYEGGKLMYDELVKRLKTSCDSCKLWDGFKCCLDGDCSAQTRLQAADAIEELAGFIQEAERDRDEYRERLDKANDAIEKLQAYADLYKELTEKGQTVARKLSRVRQEAYEQGYQDGKVDGYNLAGTRMSSAKQERKEGHGRLIDADALMKDGWKLFKQVRSSIHEMPLNNPSIPTIIEAEVDDG